MRKVMVFAAIAMLVLLAACGSKQMDAKPLKSTPTAAVTASEPEPAPESSAPVDEDSGKTAAEALAELEQQLNSAPVAGPKQATTGLPPAPAGVTGVDALKARTRAMMSQGAPVPGDVDSDYHEGSISDDLPEGYDDSGSAGDE
jgi:predicted small lipoprotein YifL